MERKSQNILFGTTFWIKERLKESKKERGKERTKRRKAAFCTSSPIDSPLSLFSLSWPNFIFTEAKIGKRGFEKMPKLPK